ETDVDRVVAAITPTRQTDTKIPGSGLVFVRGRFDAPKIEALMRSHGAQVEEYKGARVIVAPAGQGNPGLSLAFLEPGLVTVGSTALVRTAVDLKNGNGQNIT